MDRPGAVTFFGLWESLQWAAHALRKKVRCPLAYCQHGLLGLPVFHMEHRMDRPGALTFCGSSESLQLAVHALRKKVSLFEAW